MKMICKPALQESDNVIIMKKGVQACLGDSKGMRIK